MYSSADASDAASLRILHVIPDLWPGTGGPVTAVHGLTTAQRSAGRNVTIVTTSYTGGQKASAGLPAVDSGVLAFPCRHARWRWAPALGRYLTQHVDSFDIVHIHTMWQYPSWTAARAARRAGVPYVLEPAGMLASWSLNQKRRKKWLYTQTIDRHTVRGAAALRGTSMSDLSDPRVLRLNRNHFVVPHGVDTETVGVAADFVALHPHLAGRQIVLFLGRLHAKKRPDLLIRAFAHTARERGDAVLVMAGAGDEAYVQSLTRLAQDVGIAENITFTGHLCRADARNAMAAASTFVLPSQQENFGIAVAEALAQSCPVVLTSGVDIARELQSAGAAIVAEANENALAEAVSALLRDPVSACRIGHAGRHFARDNYSWAKVADDLTHVYLDILRNERTAPSWLAYSEAPKQ